MELAHRHGLYRTARALPIDYAGLRSRVQARAAASRSTTTAVARPPEFVEVKLSPLPISTGYLELLRVPLTGAVDWSQLLRAWRQSER